MSYRDGVLDRSNLVGEWILNGDALDTQGSNNGTATNVTYVEDNTIGFQKEVAVFNGTNGKINFGNIGSSIQSISFWIDLTTTTENIFEETSGVGVSVSGGTLSYGSWDNVFVNTIDTDTISTGLTHVVLTSTTGVTMTAFQFGLITSTYGDFIAGKIRTFTTELSQQEITRLYREGLGQLNNIGELALLEGLVFYNDGNSKNNITPINSSIGTLNGGLGQTTGRFGYPNSAYLYDGTDDYISFSSYDDINFTKTQPFTCFGWVYNTKSTEPQNILNKIQTTSTAGYQFYLDNSTGTPAIQLRDSSANAKAVRGSTNIKNTSTWYFIVATYDGSDTISGFKLYVNGVAESLTTVANNTLGTTTHTGEIRIGRHRNTKDEWGGKLEETGILNRELLADEVKALYQSTKRKKIYPYDTIYDNRLSQGLVLYLNGNNNGTTWYDQSGNGNNMTQAGGVASSNILKHTSWVGNGSTKNLTINSNLGITNSDSHSCFCWVAPNATIGANSVLLNLSISSGQVYYALDYTGTAFRIYRAKNAVGTDITSYTKSISTNEFVHVGYTYDGTNMYLYINGVQVLSLSATGTGSSTGFPNKFTALSSYVPGGYANFKQDELRVYDRALSEIEASLLHLGTYRE